MQRIITIPQRLAMSGDLVVIPRAEYEEYLRLKRIIHVAKPSKAEKRAIQQGRKEIKEGKYFTLQELKNALGA